MTDLPQAAVITGGTRGIGFACARKLAASGLTVLLLDVVEPAQAKPSCDEIIAAGGNALAFRVDVTDPASVAGFFTNEIKDKYHLQVLVNNAGITRDALLLRMKDEDFDLVMTVNLKGAFLCLREAAKIMTRQRSGRIINMASVVGLMGNAGQANYVASKAALIGLTKTAAKELGSRSVTVNAVAPGYIETPMTANLPQEVKDKFLESIPLKRSGLPEDVADAVAFLASDQAAYITGQVLSVNGGMYM